MIDDKPVGNLGIIHCCTTAIATLAPIRTSKARLRQQYERVATTIEKISPDKKRLSDPGSPWKVELIAEGGGKPEEVDVQHAKVCRPNNRSGKKKIALNI